jgi:hypothetical protein
VVHLGVTRNPTAPWTAQQLREATPFGAGPRCLIRDNDDKCGDSFRRVARGTGIEVLKTPYRAPRANAICERFLGSLRRECLDHFLILSARHLSRIVKEYRDYYDRSRPHQGIGQRIPCRPELPEASPVSGKLSSRPVLHGLHHDYYWQTPGSVGQGSSPLQGYLHWGKIPQAVPCNLFDCQLPLAVRIAISPQLGSMMGQAIDDWRIACLDYLRRWTGSPVVVYRCYQWLILACASHCPAVSQQVVSPDRIRIAWKTLYTAVDELSSQHRGG